MVAMIAATVMNGPVPTMFDMLMETALSSPKRRILWPGGCPVGVAVWLDGSMLIPAFVMGSQNTAIGKLRPALYQDQSG
jgi:hypothetical protein